MAEGPIHKKKGTAGMRGEGEKRNETLLSLLTSPDPTRSILAAA